MVRSTGISEVSQCKCRGTHFHVSPISKYCNKRQERFQKLYEQRNSLLVCYCNTYLIVIFNQVTQCAYGTFLLFPRSTAKKRDKWWNCTRMCDFNSFSSVTASAFTNNIAACRVVVC
ncbi:uncharacterized protein IUM83_13513 [Phytophthora cinnamomi]|uniref:uncharacterized protein n=1 Tax=Phytophthora cinnamomi TaxID=4785 RepID=UPI00355A71E9|nr:hypothetical protein IUM83_13513 [Phytophthora cinnamomi]